VVAQFETFDQQVPQHCPELFLRGASRYIGDDLGRLRSEYSLTDATSKVMAGSGVCA
jgi:hypothetical protein